MDITGWISGFFSQLGDLLSSLVNVIMFALPDSPFVMLGRDESIAEFLGYMNYFIPVDFIVATLESWLVAVGIFYIWQIGLRWLKAIE